MPRQLTPCHLLDRPVPACSGGDAVPAAEGAAVGCSAGGGEPCCCSCCLLLPTAACCCCCSCSLRHSLLLTPAQPPLRQAIETAPSRLPHSIRPTLAASLPPAAMRCCRPQCARSPWGWTATSAATGGSSVSDVAPGLPLLPTRLLGRAAVWCIGAATWTEPCTGQPATHACMHSTYGLTLLSSPPRLLAPQPLTLTRQPWLPVCGGGGRPAHRRDHH